MTAKPPTMTQYRNVCHDMLRAASSAGYPVLIDRNAHPAVVLGCGVALVIAAGQRTDTGLEELLDECTEMAFFVGSALTPPDCRVDLNDQERALAKAVLKLVREFHNQPAVLLFDRAFNYVAERDLADTLGLISVVVQLLQYIETLKPGVLGALDGELEMQAWVDRASEQLVTATDLEDL
ncbi:hypothetical protein [Gordonia insulae]|uniref:Uncharacterized protein n=1 Tax=Gordonia insulae TaxID=2420509 RepID=A0A3G8JIA1_9ACTN|nr:hypothetical protein [Gordonia insulae]AZG44821.1 hypothetical protein D7316_01412 [Gordonia insulae]